ncbi:MAG: hypothetical protein C4304_02910 [candidate division GAL15 bacterium]
MRRVRDLQGRTVGTPLPGAGAWVAINAFLRKAAPNPDRDHREWDGSGRTLSLVLVTREDVIQRDPDLVGRVVRATGRGLQYARSASPERLARELMEHPRTAEYFAGLARPFVVEMFGKFAAGGQKPAALHEDAFGGRRPRGGQHRHGRGQGEGARAGHRQHWPRPEVHPAGGR